MVVAIYSLLFFFRMLSDEISEFLTRMFGRLVNYGKYELLVMRALSKLRCIQIVYDCPPGTVTEDRAKELSFAEIEEYKIKKLSRRSALHPALKIDQFRSFLQCVMMYVQLYGKECGYENHKTDLVYALVTFDFVNQRLQRRRSWTFTKSVIKIKKQWNKATATETISAE